MSYTRRDLVVTLVALVLLLAWDATGWDLAAARALGSAQGFAWREHFLTSRVLHDGGRALGWVLLFALIAAALRAPSAGGPARAERWRWIGVMLACLLLIPTIKHFSRTSCPWDLAEFGGAAQYLSHWRWGQADGGGGHCFPSGHAVAAFAFVGQYFLWRRHDPARARGWLAIVLGAGALYGLAQLARGAHYPSHTLWSAWLCWALSAAADAWMARRFSLRADVH